MVEVTVKAGPPVPPGAALARALAPLRAYAAAPFAGLAVTMRAAFAAAAKTGD